MNDRPSATALIVGATGQDGSYLAQTLRQRGFVVHATSRSLDDAALANWRQLGIADQLKTHRLDPADLMAISALVAVVMPSQLYVLAGQSSVGLSFAIPGETILSHVQPVVAACEAVRLHAPDCHVVVAASGEVFGETSETDPARENSPFHPLNPYATAKVMAVEAARSYRDRMGIKVSIAYLFNHESPLRPDRFVFGKVRAGIAAIRAGQMDHIQLGNPHVVRDWGWAPDYCEGMAAIGDQTQHGDYILATGHSVSLELAVSSMCEAVGLEPERHLRWDAADAGRAGEAQAMHADIAKARAMLNWHGSISFPALAQALLADLGQSPCP